MDSGLIQFLVVAAFVVFSMLDGAARKKRAALPPEVGDEGDPRAASVRGQGVPDGDEWDAGGEFGEVGPGGFAPPMPVTAGEVWEEIAKLARGEVRQPTENPSFEQAGQALLEAPQEPLIEEHYEAETMARYPVVRSDPSAVTSDDVALEVQAAESPAWAADPYGRPHDNEPDHEHTMAPDVWRVGGELAAEVPGGGGGRRTARAWLYTDGGRAPDLRRAMVLHEIFGPPIALRDPPKSG